MYIHFREAFKCIIYVNFISASNNGIIIIKNSHKNFNTSQTAKTCLSHTFLIYFNTFVSHMGLFAMHVTLF